MFRVEVVGSRLKNFKVRLRLRKYHWIFLPVYSAVARAKDPRFWDSALYKNDSSQFWQEFGCNIMENQKWVFPIDCDELIIIGLFRFYITSLNLQIYMIMKSSCYWCLYFFFTHLFILFLRIRPLFHINNWQHCRILYIL